MLCGNDRFLGHSIGFNVQGTNIIFENNVIYNGDDCLAICSPADNIVFRNNYCNGGHGLSIIGQGANGIPADIKNIMYVIHILVG